MEDGNLLRVLIQEDAQVDKAVAELDNPQSKFAGIQFGGTEKDATRLIGNKGNLAMHSKIAPALERARRSTGEGIYLDFACCNLDEQAMLRLASAVEKSMCIGEFYCVLNPGNNARTNEALKRAIIATKSPIKEWNDKKLSADIVQARREREDNLPNPAAEEEAEKTEAFLFALRTRVPTANELDLAQRESQAIIPKIASKEKELKAGLDQLARGEAEKKALETRVYELQRQVHNLQVQVQEFDKKNDACRSGNDEIKAEMDALKQMLVPHEAVIKRLQEIQGMFAQLNLLPVAVAVPPPQAQGDANLCSICFANTINASFLCGHRFCRTCADAVFESEKKECPNCRDPIKGIIPSF